MNIQKMILSQQDQKKHWIEVSVCLYNIVAYQKALSDANMSPKDTNTYEHKVSITEQEKKVIKSTRKTQSKFIFQNRGKRSYLVSREDLVKNKQRKYRKFHVYIPPPDDSNKNIVQDNAQNELMNKL